MTVISSSTIKDYLSATLLTWWCTNMITAGEKQCRFCFAGLLSLHVHVVYMYDIRVNVGCHDVHRSLSASDYAGRRPTYRSVFFFQATFYSLSYQKCCQNGTKMLKNANVTSKAWCSFGTKMLRKKNAVQFYTGLTHARACEHAHTHKHKTYNKQTHTQFYHNLCTSTCYS